MSMPLPLSECTNLAQIFLSCGFLICTLCGITLWENTERPYLLQSFPEAKGMYVH